MTEGSVECPLVMIELEKFWVVFTPNINDDVTFRQLLWIPGPDNFCFFKPAIFASVKIFIHLYITNNDYLGTILSMAQARVSSA